ncbi:SRR1-domain-containing protein [Ganoderma leucocontextum]|nr:SRR1-domain-containing protein [Ganoderma leucocontextum]
MSPGEREPQFGYEDHFTPARTRKKRKNRPPADSPSPTALLDRASEELARTGWLRDTKQALRESVEEAFAFNSGVAPDVLCLGLGSPSSSRDARAQLAFLLAVCDDLRIAPTNVSVFDPVFTDQDHQLLTQLGLTELPENRMAHHRLESPTIAFMPHCDLHLYDNLFRENWSKEHLPRVLLIANRLSEYAENIPSRKLAVEYPCVARLAPCLTARPLQPCAAFPTAFNNTAVQFVRAGALADAERGPGPGGDDWWSLPPPPTVTAPSDHGTTTTTGKEASTTPVSKVQPQPALPAAGSVDVSPTSAPRSAKPPMETPRSS